MRKKEREREGEREEGIIKVMCVDTVDTIYLNESEDCSV